ncbi:DUF6503 family protein [uncultured Polaribacter sp.]|uniref:DUF6503 family protein n=1 Tax=uncultured Polaribacter sp. TaxID=174711 RepID=UPI0026271035|nr:DUF6503 family protein [uncultured Polaribacter sp.]
MKYLSIFIFLLFLACKPAQKELTAQEIIDKSILKSGVNKVANAKIAFHFRNTLFEAKRAYGNFTLTRKKDSITDILTNNTFKRFIHSQEVKLADKKANTYKNTVNSVHYFSVLPFGLNDKAVHKKLLKSSIVKAKAYYKIQITFAEEGGGEDFNDTFIYWIGKKDFLVDYLAYSYQTNGGGKRFRALKKETIVNQIRFADFDNYKPKNNNITLENIDKAFEENQLEKISEIVLENIKVTQFN